VIEKDGQYNWHMSNFGFRKLNGADNAVQIDELRQIALRLPHLHTEPSPGQNSE
jgi:hypothetical protein